MKPLTRQQIRTQETPSPPSGSCGGTLPYETDSRAPNWTRSPPPQAGGKGSVYTHFKNKEDLFLALFEHRTAASVEQLAGIVKKYADQKQRIAAF